MTTWLLPWAIIGALVGLLVGATKSRAAAGALFGALLGPIGWLVVALGPHAGRKCQDCRGAVPDDATKCRHCGSTLTTPVRAPSTSSHLAGSGYTREQLDALLAGGRITAEDHAARVAALPRVD